MSVVSSWSHRRKTKRRKLSHSSDDTEVEESVMSEDETLRSSGDAESEPEARREPISGHSRSTGTMAPKQKARNRPPGNNQARSSSLISQLPSPAGLGKSAMMTLQINELLMEVRPNHKKQLSRLEKTLIRLKEIIEGLPSISPTTALDAEKSLKKTSGVSIPFPSPRPGKKTKYTFEYQKPDDVNVAGSVPLKLNIKGQTTIDLVVTMPRSLFQDKDYLNFRAFHKRAYYLARLAAGIKDAAHDEFILEYEQQDGVDLLPVLIVRPTERSPAGFIQSKHQIRILVAVHKQAFPISKLLPGQNCVRHPAPPETRSTLEPTPFYNSCLRTAMSTMHYHIAMEVALRECESFRNVCLLGTVWLRQRGLGSEIARGGFGEFEWAAMCALLLHRDGLKDRPGLSPRYNTLQLFKAMLQVIASRDLTEPMILFISPEMPPKTEFPVIFDGHTGVNIFYRMTPWSYRVLRHEAALSLKALNARVQDNFDATFILRSTEPTLKFDQLLQVNLPSIIEEDGKPADLKLLTGRLYDTLMKGLGDRVKLIHLSTPASVSTTIDKRFAKLTPNKCQTSIGLLLEPVNADRLVDRGPTAEDREGSAEFREFWGEKAELRRFRDGMICESLVWSEDRSVIQQIIEHLLQRHFSTASAEIKRYADRYNHLLSPSNIPIQPSAAFRIINDAFQTLTSELRQLEGLPLSIRSIVPADPQLRSSSLKCPLTSISTTPSNVIIQFEGSARWPDSLPAIQYTKIAFLAKLSDVLTTTHPEVTTRIGLENTSTASSGHINTSYLDIIYPASSSSSSILSPIAFRLRIHHDREQTLLEKALADKSLNASNRDILASALAAHKRDFLGSPRHTTAIQNLCTRFPSLSPTIRLLKKWTSSHLLSANHIRDELLELIAAKVFLHPYPWSVPATAQTAFLRALVLISRWDWTTEPLVVDLSGNEEMTGEELQGISTRFEAWRKIDPAMNNVVLFAASNVETTGVVWTQGAKPPKVVASRLTALAKASVELVRSKGLQMGDEDWMSLFKSPLRDFDFLIHLKASVVMGGEKGQKAKYKNLSMQGDSKVDGIGFDPVKLYLEDLEYVLGQNVLLFHDADGGRVIAGLWNPRVLGRKTWRVRMGYSSMPVAAEEGDGNSRDEVVINQSGILAEIAMLGEGMVDKIEVVKDLVQ